MVMRHHGRARRMLDTSEDEQVEERGKEMEVAHGVRRRQEGQ